MGERAARRTALLKRRDGLCAVKLSRSPRLKRWVARDCVHLALADLTWRGVYAAK